MEKMIDEMINNMFTKILDTIEKDDKSSRTKKELNIRMAKKIKQYLLENNKTIENMNLDDAVNVAKSIKSRSFGSLNVQIDALNEVLKWAGREDLEINVNGIHQGKETKVFDIKENLIDDVKKRFYTKEEVQDICNTFINAQDKFIIYSLFLGIDGKARTDLLHLKVDQIDFDNKIIKLKDRIVYMDDYMYDICKDVVDKEFSSTYYKYIMDDSKSFTSESYELNFDSDYVIKSKPYSKNNYGLEPMKLSGINRRIQALAEVVNCNLSPKNLTRSGIMDKMYRIKKSGWTQGEIEEFLKQNNYKMQAYELKRIFESKYCKK